MSFVAPELWLVITGQIKSFQTNKYAMYDFIVFFYKNIFFYIILKKNYTKYLIIHLENIIIRIRNNIKSLHICKLIFTSLFIIP